jgi:hypothetical protein
LSDWALVEDATSLLETANVVSEVCVGAISLSDADVCSDTLDEDDLLPNALSGMVRGEVSDVGSDDCVELLVWPATEGDPVRLVALSLIVELEIAESEVTERDAEFVVAEGLEVKLTVLLAVIDDSEANAAEVPTLSLPEIV